MWLCGRALVQHSQDPGFPLQALGNKNRPSLMAYACIPNYDQCGRIAVAHVFENSG